MKDAILRLLCKIGFHKYGEWRISPLQALGSYEDDEFSYIKKCERCGHVKYGTFDRLGRFIR